jgi:hypothetical protein
VTEGKALAPMETFMERVKQKLRDDIGSLLPDEAVSDMVKKVVNDEFFAKRVVPKPDRGSYSSETIELPSHFTEIVTAAIKPVIERQVAEILVTYKEPIETQIRGAIDNGLSSMVLQAINEAFRQLFQQKQWDIEQSVRNILQR